MQEGVESNSITSSVTFLRKSRSIFVTFSQIEESKQTTTKISAIAKMPAPENKQGLMRNFLGIVPNMSERTAPVRELLPDDVLWQWLPHHEQTSKTYRRSS
ncbi:transposon Ty3-G Gag-Pol polyprotein [Elysia marginata]|uniref:Transposon Ty3-G Gag-Pol polyprotein n=1 Tax=Elysia marginata TaxID=1093978 RepID=A0AAV4FET8_9GAST|nr:transposon Ty3-G Gag-Pol polyprotein [Elysia marginata]